MNPVTHFLASWFMSDMPGSNRRDRLLITLSGVLPDLDGMGIVPDSINRIFGRPDSYYYSTFHHSLLHGLPAAIVLPLLTVWAARARFRTWAMGVCIVHVHMLLDYLGSRGPKTFDIWPIHYLAPVSEKMTFGFAWQWQLNAWPNIAFTILLLVMVFWSAVRRGYTPFEFLGVRHDGVLVMDIRHRWEQLRRLLPNQAL